MKQNPHCKVDQERSAMYARRICKDNMRQASIVKTLDAILNYLTIENFIVNLEFGQPVDQAPKDCGSSSEKSRYLVTT